MSYKLKQHAGKIRKKKYEKFSDASSAIQKEGGISKDRACCVIERKQGIEPRTGEEEEPKTTRQTTKE